MEDLTNDEKAVLEFINATFTHNIDLQRDLTALEESSRKLQEDNIFKTRELEQQLKEAKEATIKTFLACKTTADNEVNEVNQREMDLKAKLEAAEKEVSVLRARLSDVGTAQNAPNE